MSTGTDKQVIYLDDEQLNKFSLDNRAIRWGVTAYLSEYPALLVEFMIKEKGSLTAFCAIVGCSVTTMDKWMERHEALREAYEVAKAYRSWAYEKLLHDCAAGEIKGNFSAIKFGLMNYNGEDFKDKHEIEHTGNVIFSMDSGIKRKGDEGYVDEDILEADFTEVEPLEPIKPKRRLL